MSLEAIHGPGILFVRSRISPASKSTLDESTFLKWYDDEHIPEVISTSSIKSGVRYVDISKTSLTGDAQNPKPYLACYPMQDLAFTLGDEFKKINFRSSTLPGSGIIYDLVDMDVSYLGFLGATPEKRSRPDDQVKYILTLGIRPEVDPEQKQVTAFFEKQMATLSDSPHYIRTLRFKLLYARTNAQSRALKGLPTTDEPHPAPSTWLAMHEFAEIPDEKALSSFKAMVEELVKGGDRTRGWGRTETESHVWKLDRVHGEGKFFDEQ